MNTRVLTNADLPKNPKIITFDEACRKISELRKKGKTVVFLSGCFDILHTGHTRYLKLAKTVGDFLIVLLEKDETISNTRGNNRPINSLSERLEVIADLDSVDFVFGARRELKDYVSEESQRIYLERFKDLLPSVVIKPGNQDYDTFYNEQADLFGFEIVKIDSPFENNKTSTKIASQL